MTIHLEFWLTNFVFPIFGDTTLNFEIDKYSIKISRVKNYKKIIEQLEAGKHECMPTAIITVECKINQKSEVLEIVNDLSYLFSFVLANNIKPIKTTIKENDKIIHDEFNSRNILPIKYINRKAIIDSRDCETLKIFIEKTFKNYQKFKKDFGLEILILYYLLIKSTPIIELSCSLCFILLEYLSDSASDFFENSEKSPYPITAPIRNKKEILKILDKANISDCIPENVIDKIVKKISYQHPNLPDKITHITNYFSMEMNKCDHFLFHYRTHLLHFGLIKDKTIKHSDIQNALINFIDRIILHILGYKGSKYLNIKEKNKEEIL